MARLIIVKCYKHDTNFGDEVTNYFLVNAIAHQKEILLVNIHDPMPAYLGCGSILKWATSEDIVWGSGFMNDTDKCLGKPKKVCSVRGKLSRKALIAQGIPCPEIYGDPALLYPLFYRPQVEKKYKLGIIPHYVDSTNPNIEHFKKEGVLIIDILAGYKKVIESVLSCEKIVASCLHGLIISDAYNVPCMWIEFSDKVIGKGFKFRDYFSGVGRTDLQPLRITEATTLENLYSLFYPYTLTFDRQKLLNACPFKPKTPPC